MYALVEFRSAFDMVNWLNKDNISPDRIVSILIETQPVYIVSVVYLKKDCDDGKIDRR